MDDLPVWIYLFFSAVTAIGTAFGGSYWERSKSNAEAETLRLKQQSDNWERLFEQQASISEQREATIRNMAEEIREYKKLTDKQAAEIMMLNVQIEKMKVTLLKLEQKIQLLSGLSTGHE